MGGEKGIKGNSPRQGGEGTREEELNHVCPLRPWGRQLESQWTLVR